MIYRVYLLQATDQILAAETLSATDDHEAIAIAATVHDACSDACGGYEVWRGAERIAGTHAGRISARSTTLADLTERHQQSVIDLEERMQRTFSILAKSRRLLQVQQAMQKRH